MDSFFVLTLGDIIGIIIFVIVVLGVVISSSFTTFRQFRCEHNKFFENGQCHAICKKCGKDLGFIGTWRKKKNEQGV